MPNIIHRNTRMGSRNRISCGRDYSHVPNINNHLDDAFQAGFDFVSLPIMHPRLQREFIQGPAKDRQGAVTRSDLLLTSSDWGSLVVAKISTWIQMDSKCEAIRKNSEKALQQELKFASHLSVPAIMLETNSMACSNLARMINSHILAGHNHQFWIRVPLVAPIEQVNDEGLFSNPGARSMEAGLERDTWKWWNKLRSLCDSTKKLGVALELSEDLPSTLDIARWCGEPVKSAILPTSIFMTNKKGFPVLTKAHQSLIKRLFALEVQVVVTGTNRHKDKSFKCYQQYLEHVWQQQDPRDMAGQFAKGYEDYLQCPLQPLMDNLESQTYEVFEKDPVKYSQYQKAVYHAILDFIPEDEKETKTLTVMVLGAGRGPLVTASINAAKNADRKIIVYAVEKNPNAVVTLENLKYEMWGEQVTVVSSDMRDWNPPEKADIIISELLGSFGDNELSPECLDGAQHFLKEGGISIPAEYTSYIAPLSSSKLWNEARLCKDPLKPPEAPFETPYVVQLHNINMLAEAKPMFRFRHPNPGVIDNSRYEELSFGMPQDAALHGFGGYFHCTLYKEVDISIVPQTHSPGMFSWFPIYFPLRTPMYVKGGDTLTAAFWRVVGPKNVWYEWCVTEPQVTPLHNPKGRSYTIGL